MNKRMKKVKKDVLGTVKNAVSGLFEESKNATAISYSDSRGFTEKEEPGTYNSRLTELMFNDAMHYSLRTAATDEELSDLLRKVSDTLKEYDLTIRRMYDDLKAKRPVTDFPFSDEEAVLIRKLSDMAKAGRLKGTADTAIIEQSKAWVTRLVKLSIIAYRIKASETLNSVVSSVDIRAYDDKGNLIHGISEEDAEAVKIICAMTELLLKALSRIPAESKEVDPAMARIELMETLIKAIAEEDTATIERLSRYAEAAEDFEEEP